MPGIAGVIGRGALANPESVVARMISSMRHESSYVSRIRNAVECNACVGLIAHPDSFASRASESSGGGVELAFSGECFNTSGSENDPNEPVKILDAYRRKGPGFVGDLNGLFSGVVLDTSTRSALLFTDRYASERIYYHQTDDALLFASEAKALLTVLPELRVFDLDGVADFLAFGSCRGTRTLFKGITRLAGASSWQFESGRSVRRGTYFDPSEWEDLEPYTEEQFEMAFVETARSVVRRYAKTDADIGFSITGGLDTRMILACLPGNMPNFSCYTYGAAGGDTLDVRIGREISERLGYPHQTLRTNDLFVSGFQQHLDRSIFISDGCANALTSHELFFSQMARSIAPVRLTGNFGSELLRSMSTLKPLSLAGGLFDNGFAARVDSALAGPTPPHSLSRAVFDEIPLHLFGPLAIARSQLLFRTPYLDNSLVELAYRAPEASRRSPAAALRLIASGNQQLGNISTDLGFSCGRQSLLDKGRRLFRKISFKLDYWDKEGLPPKLAVLDSCRPLLQHSGLLGHHKFLPYRRWFKDELLSVAERAVERAKAGSQPWWNPAVVDRILTDHASGRENRLREINAILTLEAIERVLINNAEHHLPADDSSQAF